MARVAGKGGSVTLAGAIAAVKSWSLDIDCDALESTGMDSGGVRFYIAGLKGWKGTIEGMWDTTETDITDPGADGLLMPGTAITTITLLIGGAQAFSGVSAFATRFSVSAPVDGLITWTADIQGSGTLTWPGAA